MKTLYLMRYFLIVMLLGFTLEVTGQINTKVSLSNPYASQAAEFKKAHRVTKAYKKMVKDSLRAVKRLNKVYKYKIDSLVKHAAQTSEGYTGLRIPGYDSASLNEISTRYDNQWSAYKELYNEGLPDSIPIITFDQYISDLPNQSAYDQPLTKGMGKFDSLGSGTYIKNQGRAILADQSASMEEDLLAYSGVEGLPGDGLPELASAVPSPTIPSDQLPFRKDLKQTMKQMTSGHLGKYSSSIENAHKSMASLKKKYITVPSLGDLRTATKRNSLSGQPLNKRLKLGGNLHIKQGSTINIDFSPSLAYRLDRKSSVGLSAMYRSSFGGDTELSDAFDPSLYGVSTFLEVVLYKNFYGRTDIESLHSVNNDQSVYKETSGIISGALVGIGRSFELGKAINGKVSVQYNFLYQDNGLYSSPWVFRFGFDLKELGKKNIGIGNLKKKTK